MTNAYQVISVNAAHPDWTAEQVAAHLGCTWSYVRATGQRQGLVFVSKRDRPWMKLPTAQERYDALMASLSKTARSVIRSTAKDRIADAALDWSVLVE